MIVYNNGDSFGVVSNGKTYSEFIADHFDARLINQAKSGASNSRIFRTTVRDLLSLDRTSEDVLVLINISTIYRFEYWSNLADGNDGHFFSVLMSNPDPVTKLLAKELLSLHNIEAEITKLYYELTLLTTFLTANNFQYLIWNGPNTNEDVDHQTPFISDFSKIVDNDPHIIPFGSFNFCQYCLDQGYTPIDYDKYGLYGHHGEEAHKSFANYLLENYLNEI
ncbi:hypothetical protein UFOVP112_242 [uncultured Caudovirales phage]|uniref:Uncharacterized protein n=1 Tax=uncultured Caudovirales phage TaxID=2100421 RepID=A0A6J5L3U7_9CAUD|nr:hypothetical protein UFOVP112_242 [uncultured Caudovirales phage]